MKRISKRVLFWLGAHAIVGSLSLINFCWTHRVWSVTEWRVYQAMSLECHPAWRDFHFGRVRAGDSVEEVIALTRPVRVERDSRWIVLKYHRDGLCFTGLTAMAYDGQMVGAYAWSCTWTRQFFDTMSEQQRAEFSGKHHDQPARIENAIFVRRRIFFRTAIVELGCYPRHVHFRLATPEHSSRIIDLRRTWRKFRTFQLTAIDSECGNYP
jgi:hypothetical protein